MCGEKLTNDRLSLAVKGSPPRVRGKDNCSINVGFDCGITPACAGKRLRAAAWTWIMRDHPRVCGEKGYLPRPVYCESGSPPRVRGKAFQRSRNSFSVRITPACAGKSCTALSAHRRCRDHPRVCGEKPAAEADGLGTGGSPPRVRGKGRFPQIVIWENGITPACAGKRRSCSPTPRRSWDHPRVCGEKIVILPDRATP